MKQLKNKRELDFLPDDKKYRVIWTVEGLLKSGRSAPNIALIFRYLNKGKIYGFETHVVSYRYMCICIAGQVYRGREPVEIPLLTKDGKLEKFSFYDGETYYVEEASFHIDYNDPVRHYSTSLAESKKYILPLEMLRPSVKRHFFPKEGSQASQITQLISNDGKIIYVPTFEVFQKMLVPQNKEIQRKILVSHIDEITKEYLVLENCLKTDDNIYKVQFKKKREGLKEASKHFIACMRFDKQTERLVNNIFAYVQSNYDGNTSIMPEVEPYTDMDITARGIWLDENVFLVLNIKAIHLGEKIKLSEIHDDYTNNPSGNLSKSFNRQMNIHENDLPYDNLNDPGANAGLQKVISNVIVQTNISILNSFLEKKSKGNVDKSFLDENDPVAVSFGDESNACGSRNTARCFDYEVSNADLDGGLVFIYETLLRLQRASYIDNVNCLSDRFEVKHGFYLNTFPKKLLPNRKNSWLLKDDGNLRRYLLARVTLNSGKDVVLFEIEKRKSNEAFCGIIFAELPDLFRKLNIFLEFVTKFSGRFRERVHGRLVDKEIPINGSYIFSHSFKDGRLGDILISKLKRYENE
ncbi:hypothetical protein [Francisella philomiragia]|uniref:hypothetical protein n=1 Tax=Francisella philomiragia TaxID=28110 RepID=UPI001B8B7EB7|nr:hypothetical protein [Francisella philomiragia]QUE31245.1 hypothetical protein IMS64_08510 [Francisella philomiragia]